MANATPTTCGHEPHCAKGLCKKCYRRTYEREKDRNRLRAWQEANREKTRESARAYSAAHREEEAARAKAWREANPERHKANIQAWQEANPENHAVAFGRTRAKRLGVKSDMTLAEWRSILAEFDGHCAYCDRADRALQMEHMVPISRGGPHTASNVVPACGPCNNSKHDQTALEFAGWSVPPRRRT